MKTFYQDVLGFPIQRDWEDWIELRAGVVLLTLRKRGRPEGDVRTGETDNGMSFQDGETWLFWQQSTDNVDPQSVIRYDVHVNGVFDHSLLGYSQTVVYGNPGVFNTYQVIAVDSAGNQSAPATLTTCAGAVC